MTLMCCSLETTGKIMLQHGNRAAGLARQLRVSLKVVLSAKFPCCNLYLEQGNGLTHYPAC
jgi:hypothetical protein